MSKIKNYMMDIEEKVFDIDGLENKIGECENIAEMKTFVVEKLGLTVNFDITIAEGVVDDMWNDFWGYY
tara:strand:- start:294 stop:500 length:207 start_codon:yes stop_codon:yes gene_type:complete